MSLLTLILVIFIVLYVFGGGFYGHNAGWFVNGNPLGYTYGGVGLIVLIIVILLLLRGV